MARLSVSLLGSFEVTLDGEPVTGKYDKVLALLAYLVVESDRAHRRDTLAALLWPDYPDRSARTNLRNALSHLRAVLGDRDANAVGAMPPFLLVSRETIQFNAASDYWLDVEALEGCVQADRVERPFTHCLEEAVDLYRGPFLEGFSIPDSAAFEEWALLTRERLEGVASTAFDRLIDKQERQGALAIATTYARRWVELEPWQERAHRRLMRLLALSGERSAALAQYNACRHLLAEELGVEPSAETTALYERIRDGEVPEASDRGQQAGGEEAKAHNLPVPLNPLIGREKELSDLERLLRDPDRRLVTVVGPGGIGKTHLALVAAAAVNDAQQRVVFVSLAPVHSPDAVAAAVAQAMGFAFDAAGELWQQLLDYLHPRRLLLLLDNVEHLLARPEAASDPNERSQGDLGDRMSELLRTAPSVKVLATSRARLNVPGEHVYPLAGIDHPQEMPVSAEGLEAYAAVQLFLHSARRVQPGFDPAGDELMHVGRIARLVQGMPLAILIAAAWVEVLSPAGIAAEIEQGLDFLEADWRGMPERQRSMRAVFDHSWALLPEQQQAVLVGLSLFRGGFTREAAQQVTGASLRDLMRLVDRSLLHRASAPSTMPRTGGRYQIHELLRQYAAEKLAQTPAAQEAARDRHAAHYAMFLQRFYKDFASPRQRAVLAEVDIEIDNVHTAWHRMAERRMVEHLDRAIDGLGLYHMWRKRLLEGTVLCRIAAQTLSDRGKRPASQPAHRLRVLSKVLAWRAWFATDDRLVISELLHESLALLGRSELAELDVRSERAFALQTMVREGPLADYEEVRRLGQQSLALYEALDDRAAMALALESWGWSADRYSHLEEANQYYERSATIRESLGDQLGRATCLKYRSWCLIPLGQFEEAESCARESLAIREEDLNAPGDGYELVGWAIAHRSRLQQARPLIERAVEGFEDRGARPGAAFANSYLGVVETHLGRYDEARVRAQRGLDGFRLVGWQRWSAFSSAVVGMAALGAEAYREAGQFLEQSTALYSQTPDRHWRAFALALSGYAAHKQSRPQEAQTFLGQALRFATETKAVLSLLYALPVAALLLMGDREVERAVELYALASRYPFVAHSRWFEDVAGKHIAAAAQALPPDVVAAAQERGRALDLWATAEELLAEFRSDL
jgi:predicted ATPase/DNA-binding SARP family transcriptional activator